MMVGIDVVYESVGGTMFDTCVNALAKHARLIVIGWISGYQTDKGFNTSRTLSSLPQRLLPKSASVRGFFLFNHPKEIKVGIINLHGSCIVFTCNILSWRKNLHSCLLPENRINNYKSIVLFCHYKLLKSLLDLH